MLSKMRFKHSYRWLGILLAGLLLSSCAASTGTKIPLSRSNRAKVKKIAVRVQTKENFSIRVSRDEANTAASVYAALFGDCYGYGCLVSILALPIFAVAAAEAGVRHHSDKKREGEMEPIVGVYDPEKVMGERLHLHLESANSFSAVEHAGLGDMDILKGKGFDGVLEVTLENWGLIRCVDRHGRTLRVKATPECETEELTSLSESTKKCTYPPQPSFVQVVLNMHGKIYLLENNSTVWERNELFIHPECHSLGDLQTQEGLLEAALTEALDKLSAKTVSEILSP